MDYIKEHTIIEEFEEKQMLLNVFEPNDTAIVTHFLNNLNKNDSERLNISKLNNKMIFNIVENYIEYKNVNTENNLLTVEALQQLLVELKNIPFPPISNFKFRFIDLFAGVGGFRLASQKYGGKCVYSSEWNEAAKKTYRNNFGEIPFGDITLKSTQSFIPNEFDLLCAGFPCQAFSIAGNRKGFADTRGTLFFEIEKIIENHRPKIVLLENVKNLKTHDNGRTFNIMIQTLKDKLGYEIKYEVLNSMTHANIPQNRERIFIIAFDPKKIKNYKEFEFPNPIELKNSIHNILENEKVDDYYYYQKTHPYYNELDRNINSFDTIYQWRRVYVRENKNNVCPTLTANMGSGGHNVPIIRDKYGIRKLTPKECFRFQGFPNEFVLPNISRSKLYMQAGNSVTVPLVERIVNKLVDFL